MHDVQSTAASATAKPYRRRASEIPGMKSATRIEALRAAFTGAPDAFGARGRTSVVTASFLIKTGFTGCLRDAWLICCSSLSPAGPTIS